MNPEHADAARIAVEHALTEGKRFWDKTYPLVTNGTAEIDFVTSYASLYIERIAMLEHEARYDEEKAEEKPWE